MNKQFIIIAIAGAVVFAGGFVTRGIFSGGSHEGHQHGKGVESGEQAEFYTCSMHPQIQQPGPGKCPLCGMDLIPVVKGQGENEGPRELAMSPRAMSLAEIQSSAVERKYVMAEVRMVGKVTYDETKVSYITAWVPGRLDRLYVDYTGIKVNEGDHLVNLYSPDLLQAQEELISALTASTDMKESDSEYLKERAENSIQSAREKLRLWGLSPKQIEDIESQRQPTDHITINSPISGIVVHKNAVEGMYVNTGTQVYTIADLSHVWVKLDAYESDLAWLHYGQEVEFRTEAYPGEVFKGQIAFIDPVLDSKTRTVKMRVNLPNPEGRLKPEMFVRAIVKSKVSEGARVLDESLAGKWISPMHPEIIKDAPGKCDVCGMDLVSAESLGYVASTEEGASLVIPASAPLVTGKRAVVYIDKGEGIFEGREIELGSRAGDYYLVKSGIEEGEKVVTKGNFKIDSAVQIMAKPSMMNPKGGGPMPGHNHGAPPKGTGGDSHEGHQMESMSKTFQAPEAFQNQVSDLVNAYLKLQNDLSHDEFETAKKSVSKFKKALDEVDMGLVKAEAHNAWMTQSIRLKNGVEAMEGSEAMAETRQGFEQVSNALIFVVKQFGTSKEQSLFVYNCPMAFGGKGGDWLQSKEGTENPYYGSKMFKCGSIKERLVEVVEHEGHNNE